MITINDELGADNRPGGEGRAKDGRVEYMPQSVEEMAARFPLALAEDCDSDQTPADQRPGLSPTHIFDWEDGMRMIVSMDIYDAHQAVLHVSISEKPGSQIDIQLLDWMQRYSRRICRQRYFKIINKKLTDLAGCEIPLELAAISDAGIPHFVGPNREDLEALMAAK